MTIEKKIIYKEGAEKVKFLADLKARFEKAKEGGFEGNIREFILKEKYKDILGEAGYAKGGSTNKPNGLTTKPLQYINLIMINLIFIWLKKKMILM